MSKFTTSLLGQQRGTEISYKTVQNAMQTMKNKLRKNFYTKKLAFQALWFFEIPQHGLT